MPAAIDTVSALVPGTITVAEPDVVGRLAVFPLIASRGISFDFVAYADAVGDGAAVRELPRGASVNDLVVHNPLGVPVLVYDGEEVLGAQQNRTFDVSALIAARSDLQVPVSCVEAGRWDGRRHGEDFRPAPQAAFPELRRIKNERVRENLRAGAEARAHQGEVWDAVAAKSVEHGVRSASGAMHDVYENRRGELARVREGVRNYCSQVGMLAAIDGRFVVLDYVGEPDVFAALHARLLEGYALDALKAGADTPAPALEDARDFVALLLRAPAAAAPTPGLGSGLAFEFSTLAGTGLAHEGELVALTAFAQGGSRRRR